MRGRCRTRRRIGRSRGWPVTFRNQYQRFHRGLPFNGIVFGVRQLGRRVMQGDQRFALGQFNRIVKGFIPSLDLFI
jgi:hypothetical protein